MSSRLSFRPDSDLSRDSLYLTMSILRWTFSKSVDRKGDIYWNAY
jgi:hypothetical protein